MGSITTRVAGVTFKNSDGTNRQDILRSLSAYDFIHLKDDSSEIYPEAVGVYDLNNHQIGNLPKEIAQGIREHLIEDGQIEGCSVLIDAIGADDGKPLGCIITISHELIMDDDENDQNKLDMELLKAEQKSIAMRYQAKAVEENIYSGSDKKSNSGTGCTIIMVIIGLTVGILLYRFFNGIK